MSKAIVEKRAKKTIEEWGHPDAPEKYEMGRECDKCFCVLSRYTAAYEFKAVDEVVHLCGPCDYKRRYEDVEDALEFVGRDSERKQIREKRRQTHNRKRNERDRRDYAANKRRRGVA